MATLYFRVYGSASVVAAGDKLQDGTITIGATSAQSAVIAGTGNNRQIARLYADTDCFVTWGSDPTALGDGTEGMPLGSDNPEYVSVVAGHKLAVIQRT